MKRLFYIISGAFLLLAVSAATSACGDDGKGGDDVTASIEPSATELNFTAEGGEQTITVTTVGEWDAVSSDSWIELQKSGTLTKKGTIVIKVRPNGSHEARQGSVRLLSGSARATVAVNQEGKGEEPADPGIQVPEGYRLVWNDEFDGDALDTSVWTHEVQGPGWVNNELQAYVNGSCNGRNVTEVSDGRLTITAFSEGGKVYSGRIYAKVGSGWKYGIFEARMKLPKGKGTWPAFWMMPVNNNFSTNPWPRCGEIDIMEEVGYNPNYTSSSIHCESYNHVLGTQKTAERYTAGAQEEYHVYRLEWTENAIVTYVDGNPLLTFRNDGQNNVSTWPFNCPFYLILNLAWGGSWGGAQGVDPSALPARFEIDYVRVFQPEN